MHPKFCIVSDFPTVLHKDEENTAHCEDGPQLAWSDGFKTWYIHGVAVNEQIVMRPEMLTLKQIDDEENEEVRRVMVDRFGWMRYLEESEAKILDRRDNDVDNTMELLVQTKKNERRLVCSCRSTGRRYAPGVPDTVNTCAEAQAWMRGGSSFAGKKATTIGAS
jgi:hypothetical protein